ncbi:LolA family protein [Cohnella candidum]|uniref:Outer membrane lipoprotein carrier protein LolA n=1 Tax=Cohnella candidum TaxID=2674991 RepID=A0A3G3K039_9BACL|nr:outer membrane lipoprotein carrier protein LolA [Cohnella candidum]AYQ73752.1 outer membrane lipoprotein carrier protein LolA [Cohnella candidum]
MRRRIPWIVVAVMVLTAILSGCGSKDATSIVKDLDKVMGKMESYQASGTMTLHTGQQPLNYKVEVWYQKPKFYRIALTNEKRDITQIVLRNDDGVFVLTPSLNKSYRFQSDWPDNQGQVYLYQTLVQSIQMDNSRQFATDKDAYVFDVMAGNYQNGSFARQKIWLSKDDYAPKQVQVTDTNNNLMVEVNFDSFDFGKKFDANAFDMARNMGKTADESGQASGQTDVQPSASPSDEGAMAPAADDAKNPDGQAAEETLSVVEPDPDALPQGVSLKDTKDVQLGEESGFMLRYTGTYDFTITERVPKAETVMGQEGMVLDLGFTVGLLTGDTTKTLTWTYGGVEYRLTTNDLPQEDMVRAAQSMVDASGK